MSKDGNSEIYLIDRIAAESQGFVVICFAAMYETPVIAFVNIIDFFHWVYPLSLSASGCKLEFLMNPNSTEVPFFPSCPGVVTATRSTWIALGFGISAMFERSKSLVIVSLSPIVVGPPRAGYLFLAHSGNGKPFLIKNAIALAFACSKVSPCSLRSVRIASISVI